MGNISSNVVTQNISYSLSLNFPIVDHRAIATGTGYTLDGCPLCTVYTIHNTSSH